MNNINESYTNLYNSGKMFIKVSLKKLNEISEGNIPKKRELIEFIDGNIIGKEIQYKPFYRDIINDNIEILKKLPEAQEFTLEILKNETIKENITNEIGLYREKKS